MDLAISFYDVKFNNSTTQQLSTSLARKSHIVCDKPKKFHGIQAPKSLWKNLSTIFAQFLIIKSCWKA